MTTRPSPQCATCTHLAMKPERICAAFTGGIPDEIWQNREDHREAFPGDHGIRWDPLGGREFPEYAMSDEGA